MNTTTVSAGIAGQGLESGGSAMPVELGLDVLGQVAGGADGSGQTDCPFRGWSVPTDAI